MPVKIRLQRHGRKKYAYYHIVVADSRAPRDGRFIERIGLYNPNTNPATIDLDFDRALSWLNNGAQPTDTVRAILSYDGVLYKKHLLGGVVKGAFTEEEAERRFKVWMTEKETKIQAKRNRLAKDSESSKKTLLEAETKINQERAAALAKREAEAIAAKAPKQEETPVVVEESPSQEVAEATAAGVSSQEETGVVVEETPSQEVAEATAAGVSSQEETGVVIEETPSQEVAEATAAGVSSQEEAGYVPEEIPEADNTEASDDTTAEEKPAE